jgi:hypothetical protein
VRQRQDNAALGGRIDCIQQSLHYGNLLSDNLIGEIATLFSQANSN